VASLPEGTVAAITGRDAAHRLGRRQERSVSATSRWS
jgi:hypothetical protein